MSTILIVDDEVDLMKMVGFQFKTRGHQVHQCANGKEALELLKTMRPDLIILDLNMPQMGGIETYQHLCAGNTKPAYPVLVLTARANTESLFKEFDIDGFATKPFKVEDLINQAEEIIKRYDRTHRKGGFAYTKTKTVSLVEDDPQMLETVGLGLLASGYGVLPLTSGHHAQQTISKDMPDAVLIKLAMPDMPGDVLAIQLKSAPLTKNIPVFVYMPKDQKMDPNVLAGIRAKASVINLIEYSQTTGLVAAIDKYFNG